MLSPNRLPERLEDSRTHFPAIVMPLSRYAPPAQAGFERQGQVRYQHRTNLNLLREPSRLISPESDIFEQTLLASPLNGPMGIASLTPTPEARGNLCQRSRTGNFPRPCSSLSLGNPKHRTHHTSGHRRKSAEVRRLPDQGGNTGQPNASHLSLARPLPDRRQPQITHRPQSLKIAPGQLARPVPTFDSELLPIRLEDLFHKPFAPQRHPVREIPYPAADQLPE